MAYEKKSYHAVSNGRIKPLLVTSSGGGGHITATIGLYEYLMNNQALVELPLYSPVLFEDKPVSKSRSQIQRSIKMIYSAVFGASIQSILSYTAYPTLPDKKSLANEIVSLSLKEKVRQRPYIDMLLDVYPAGYEYAAIWNIFQRNDKAAELKKLVALQERSDKQNQKVVIDYFLVKLKEAAKNYAPYTEIINTQPMNLAGLCDAVLTYNLWLEEKPYLNAPKIVIHQYMTDLPTKGAVHFFNALARLNPKQQEQMILYALEIEEDIIQYFFPQGLYLQGIFAISAQQNPMVRSGLKNAHADHSGHFHKPVMIELSGEKESVLIREDEIIASILLGSQVGSDSIAYIETLLHNGIDKVFVFGGRSPGIHAEIANIVALDPQYIKQIIPLNYQNDKDLAALMSRSNVIIIRGGGLSVMEQLAMNHSKEQAVFVHHANNQQSDLTSGIPWEDENADSLIAYLLNQGVYALKTTPERAQRDIAQARLVAAVKRYYSHDLTRHQCTEMLCYIESLSQAQLVAYMEDLKHYENRVSSYLPLIIDHCMHSQEEKVS